MSSTQRSDWEQGYADGLVEGQRLKDAAVQAAEQRAELLRKVAFQRGAEQGQRDALANLDNAAVYARIMKVLDDNGINMQDASIHSWRCFDKERYPIPCSCAGEVVVEILAAIKGGSDE
jgi:hypothetical protein